MNRKEGSILGGILLVAGSCIGAGMLALPVITGMGGFLPAIVMLAFAWLFMTTTGMLLLEANLALGYNLSLISLSKKTLGPAGKIACGILFVFLFYSLSVAYIAVSGAIVGDIFEDLFHISFSTWIGSTFFTLIFGIVLFVGTKPVDYLNRFLMLGLIVSYFALVVLGSAYIQPALLTVRHWTYSIAAIPILIISFGFHNMIPSLAMYFKGDVKRLRITVFIGALLPLCIYLVWEAVILGIVPVEGRGGLLEALDQGQVATQALRTVVGSAWITTVGQTFALFAIITSFLAQSLSLVDFLADGLKVPKVKGGRLMLVLLTLIPPFSFAYLYPDIFIQALNMAGGFSAVLLFGVMPVLMIWVIRYKQKAPLPPIMPTGRVLLSVVLIVAIAIFSLEMAQELGFSLLPKHVEGMP